MDKSAEPYPFHLKRKNLFVLFLLLFVFVFVRAWAMKNNGIILEDSDSISYLSKAKVFLQLDYQKIRGAGVDTTPFYPLLTALFSIPGWPVEYGARLCSLVFSSLLFIAVAMIGMRVANMGGVILGLLILTFSPIMISLSFSVLTEPSYVSTIYIGMGLFMLYYRDPGIILAIIIGAVFGLGFLNRTEGIIYIAIIPLFHFIQYFFRIGSKHDLKKIVLCNLFYVLSFSVVIAPQIYHVSSKMGRLAINGREAWMLILHQADGKSYEEKIYGLDYSESEINRKYVQRHPEVQGQIYGNLARDLKKYFKDIAGEFSALMNIQLGLLIGPIGFMFFAFGLSALYKRQFHYEIILFLGFTVVSLIPPLMHNVVMRHIVIIAPMIMLIEGIGIYHVAESLSGQSNRHYLKQALSITLLFFVLSPFAQPLIKMFREGTRRDVVSRYHDNPASYADPARKIRNIADQELDRKPRVLSKKPHISFFADADHVFAPYTNYEGLVRYAILNEVDFLFLQHQFLREYPFLKRFKEKETPDFVIISEYIDLKGERVELYRMKPNGNT